VKAINWGRWWPVSGIAFVALYVVGMAFVSSPDSGHTDAQILAHYAKRSNRVQDIVAFFLVLAAVLALIWFVALLRNRLARAEGSAGVLTTLATGSGLVASVLWIVAFALWAGPSSVISDTSKFRLDPNTFRLLNDISYGIWFSGTTVMAILVVATAVLAGRTGLLPKWLVWLSYPAALTMLVAFFFIPFLIMLGWILVVSLTLIVRPGPEEAPQAVMAA
jgi:hypothetical protein